MYILNPFAVFHLATLVGIANLWRTRREGRRCLLLVTLPYVALTAWCTPAVGYLALGSLEWPHPPLRQRPTDAEAIVVLGGSVLPADAGRARPELGRSTFYRCRHAVEVYRQGRPCLVMVSGGRVTSDASTPPCARLMRDFLLDSAVRPPDIIEEGRSRSTFENAVECAKLIRRLGVRKVILVTEATHMTRALGSFRGQGVDAVPSACNYQSTGFEWSVLDFLPSSTAALNCQTALHEWLGIAWYRLRGRM
jgi:uncharacterized SAM-binding protein YcdF (DUF218 family)